VNGNDAPLQRGPCDLRSLGRARGRGRRTRRDKLVQHAYVELCDTGGRNELERGHALVRRLPEHGRLLHPVVVELRHVVDVRDGRLAPTVSALSSRWHSSTARRGSPSPPPDPSHAALVIALLVAVALVVVGCGSSSSKATTTTSSASGRVAIGQGLEGPTGLKATVYATGLRDVSAFAFDASGRLWATTSAASDHSRDGVYLMPRAGGKPVKVISGVKGPLGLLWHAGRLYVTSLGRVEVFSGLSGVRFAKRRAIIVQPAGHGWNNAIVALPGGRLAMGITSACDHCVSHSRWSATIVSFRPDGSDVRLYATGIRAPFGVLYDKATGALLTSMNQRDDLGAKTPGDWLALVRAGQNWRFPGCYGQGGSACSGVPAPLAVLDKHAAAGGVAIISGQLGSAAGHAALVTEWERGVVLSVPLRSAGAGYASAKATPLLTGFRSPLPLAVASDGALLVGDWTRGIVYRIARV
jgi:glucose/arabinose dehydrogenase